MYNTSERLMALVLNKSGYFFVITGSATFTMGETSAGQVIVPCVQTAGDGTIHW